MSHKRISSSSITSFFMKKQKNEADAVQQVRNSYDTSSEHLLKRMAPICSVALMLP